MHASLSRPTHVTKLKTFGPETKSFKASFCGWAAGEHHAGACRGEPQGGTAMRGRPQPTRSGGTPPDAHASAHGSSSWGSAPLPMRHVDCCAHRTGTDLNQQRFQHPQLSAAIACVEVGHALTMFAVCCADRHCLRRGWGRSVSVQAPCRRLFVSH